MIPSFTWLRLAMSAMIALALAAGVWKIRMMGYNASESKWLAKVQQDDINAKKEALRASEAGKINLEQSLELLEGKTHELAQFKNRNAGLQLSLKRVFNSAQQCSNQAVQPGQAATGYDAADTRWTLERGSRNADAQNK